MRIAETILKDFNISFVTYADYYEIKGGIKSFTI